MTTPPTPPDDPPTPTAPTPPVPDSPTPTAPTPPTPDPPSPTDGSDRLSRVENILNGLLDVVASLVPKDATPTKKPWTHRGSQ